MRLRLGNEIHSPLLPQIHQARSLLKKRSRKKLLERGGQALLHVSLE